MKTKYASTYEELEDTKGVIRMLHSIPKVQYNERRHHILSVFDIYFTEFGTALTTSLPILFQYCYRYCYSDSRNR